MKDKITNRVHTEYIYKVVCIENVSFGFTHFAVSLKKPRMSKHLLWKRKIQRHQDNRPVNCMETDNIVSDQMQICRPVFFKVFRVISIAVITDSSDIVGKGIQPYIDNVPFIKINRNSPFE